MRVWGSGSSQLDVKILFKQCDFYVISKYVHS